MNCKNLKITLKQFDTYNNTAICKLCILYNNNRSISIIEINLYSYIIKGDTNNNLISELIHKLDILDNLLYIVKLARVQIKAKKPFGIDTYYRWSSKS